MISRRERFLQIIEVLTKHGFGFALGGLKPQWRAPLARVKLIDPQTIHSQPEHLRMALEELGPTFIKLGQLVSTRPDVLPPGYADELLKLQDDTPPIPVEQIRAMIEAEPDSQAEEILTHMDPEPVATGSIGQAHAAVFRGHEVIVKVRRPGVTDEVNRDLEILQDMSSWVARYWTAAQDYDLEGLVEEFSASLRDELDFIQEARNSQRMAENFIGHPQIHIPEIYWEATTSRVLTMERMFGVKINDYDALEAEGVNRHLLAKEATDAICKMVFEDGFFHADPHPGNLFVEPDGRIALIDFGMVGNLSEEFRDHLIILLLGVVQNNPRRAATGLLGLTDSGQHDISKRDLERDVSVMMRRYANKPLEEVRVGELMADLISVLRHHKLQLPRESALLLRMLVTAESMGTGLDPGFDLVSAVQPYAERFIINRLSPDMLFNRLRSTIEEAVQMGVDVPEYVRRFLVVLERGGFDVHLRTDELDPLVKSGAKIGHQVVAGGVIAATINGTAHIIASDPERWKKYHTPLIVGGMSTVAALSGYLAVSSNTERVRHVVRVLRGNKSKRTVR